MDGVSNRTRTLVGLASCATLALTIAPTALAQSETQRLTAAAPAAGARFGDGLAMAGRLLAVGAPGQNAVHVFEHADGTGFAAGDVLVPPTASAAAAFGEAIALDGGLLAVGAWGDDVVWVWTRQPDGTFGGMVRVEAPVPQAGARFGATVAVRGDRLFVGAPFEDSRTGAVHVFARQADGSFAHVRKLRPVDSGPNHDFGSAVAVDEDGTTLFASAVIDDEGATYAGATYVFEEFAGTFVQTAKLIAPDATANDLAGRVIACSGDLLAVGVREDDDRGADSGSVNLWQRGAGGAFAHAGKLIAPDGLAGDWFGARVAVHGDRVLVGAMRRDNGIRLDVGRAYVFERADAASPFQLVQSLDSPASQIRGNFGSAVTVGALGFAVGGGGADGAAGEVFTSVEPVGIDLAASTVEVEPGTVGVGEEATVTVVPLDDLGEVVGPGLDVVVTTSLGQLLGAVVDEGDGRYTQRVVGDAAGTAEIGATIGGEAVVATASLTVEAPEPVTRVAGERRDGSVVPFESIQAAVDASRSEDLARVLIAPGRYEEIVRVHRQQDLALVGLVAHGLVTVRGLRVTFSRDVTVEGLHVEPAGRATGGVQIGPRAVRVTLRGVLVEGTDRGRSGIDVYPGSRDVVLDTCRVEGAAGDGVRVFALATGVGIFDCTVVESARNGIELGLGVRAVRIEGCSVLDNGTRGRRAGGYGIVRHGAARHARPEDVTLIRNDVRGNSGRAHRNRSTADFGRYDLMFDSTDDQEM